MRNRLSKDKQRQYREAYFSREYYDTLGKVYTTCSHAKRIAFEHCENVRLRLGGYGARILTSNAQMFTYGFRVNNNGIEELHIITPYNYYIINYYG